ncbi:monocarboxylate transporter 13-like isoform X2 [Acanthaster planci]|uniref:Monocarboxylate transporter 13-like isoform X2 n=1 Tax=Acanthaster planci TaxID=133434 RepID=A0A8B7Y644_ACAPL|nr:monocarboxylate transporter 13-like isoform X2 [Acanthaster planci]
MPPLRTGTSGRSAPVVGALSRLVGSRPMMVLGGLMNTLGIILASVSSTVSLFTVFVIGLSGIGTAFTWYVGFAVMASYFKDKYPLAIGIATMGIPLGVMAYGPMTQVLLDTYGWRGAMLIWGGISFHAVPCSVLVRRDPSSIAADTDRYQEVSVGDEERNNQEEGEAHVSDTSDCARGFPGHCEMAPSKCCLDFIAAFDFKLLADVRFVLLVIGHCTAAFSYSAWVVYMVSHGQFQGLNEVQASLLPTAFGVGNVIGKSVAPLLQQMGLKLSLIGLACVGSTIVSTSFVAGAFIRHFIGQLAITGLVGVGYAMLYQAVDVMIRFLSTDDRLLNILAWQGIFTGVAGALGGLLSGWIYEWTGSFTVSFFVYSGLVLLSIPIFITEAIYAKRSTR